MPDHGQRREQANKYMKYSGMAFQMVAIIFIVTLLGKRLNDHWELDPPYLTAAFALFSVLAALYLSLKDLINPK
ncbi:MAG: AtpZ/AtpI family protein [Bacteroidota bacterium]